MSNKIDPNFVRVAHTTSVPDNFDLIGDYESIGLQNGLVLMAVDATAGVRDLRRTKGAIASIGVTLARTQKSLKLNNLYKIDKPARRPFDVCVAFYEPSTRQLGFGICALEPDSGGGRYSIRVYESTGAAPAYQKFSQPWTRLDGSHIISTYFETDDNASYLGWQFDP